MKQNHCFDIIPCAIIKDNMRKQITFLGLSAICEDNFRKADLLFRLSQNIPLPVG